MHDQATGEVRKGHGWPEANLPPGSRRTFAASVFRRDHLPLEPLQPALRIPLKLAGLGVLDRSTKKPIDGLALDACHSSPSGGRLRGILSLMIRIGAHLAREGFFLCLNPAAGGNVLGATDLTALWVTLVRA